MPASRSPTDRIVITGIGLVSAVGADRESAWRAIRAGTNGARRLTGIRFVPDELIIGAPVILGPEFESIPYRLKAITLNRLAAQEAVQDANLDFSRVDLDRAACAISGHMGDTGYLDHSQGREYRDQVPNATPWWHQWLPDTACGDVASHYGLRGPRMCHSVACASGLVDILSAVRSIRDGQCDLAIAGSAEAICPLFAAGFHQMRVLAYHDDATKACRPFDLRRTGFIMGEGAGIFVVERLSHALARGARIYSEVLAARLLSEAHHVTGLDAQSDTLTRLIHDVLKIARLAPEDIDYINAHGTATEQNDPMETRGIRRAFGRHAEKLAISSTKSMVGHLVNAAGSLELGITALALRDGFVPPTINLTEPDPRCDLDYVPNVGRPLAAEHAMKISIAFGGHLAGVILRRWNSD